MFIYLQSENAAQKISHLEKQIECEKRLNENRTIEVRKLNDDLRQLEGSSYSINKDQIKQVITDLTNKIAVCVFLFYRP